MTGHVSGDEGDNYGYQYPVSVLARELEKVVYEGLDLGHVKVSTAQGRSAGRAA